MGLRNKKRFDQYNIFFFTTTCYQWLKLLSVGNNMQIVIDSLNFCYKKYDTSILAYVLMPNHIHLVIHFKEGDKRVDFMRDFKKFTSTQIRKEIERNDEQLLNKLRVNIKGQISKVWQDRYDELYLETRELLEKKLDYIHLNPLQ
jgi:putative transposase